jgi:hypothetical protein
MTNFETVLYPFGQTPEDLVAARYAEAHPETDAEALLETLRIGAGHPGSGWGVLRISFLAAVGIVETLPESETPESA